MLEHVHPNVEGYFRLATAFCPAITALGRHTEESDRRRDGVA
jgi:hypothetical protein